MFIKNGRGRVSVNKMNSTNRYTWDCLLLPVSTQMNETNNTNMDRMLEARIGCSVCYRARQRLEARNNAGLGYRNVETSSSGERNRSSLGP